MDRIEIGVVARPHGVRGELRVHLHNPESTALDDAELILALGGDGFLLHTLHEMLDRGRVCPIFGMNRGTVGFLMNEWRLDALDERLARAKSFSVAPLEMKATTVTGAVGTSSPCPTGL